MAVLASVVAIFATAHHHDGCNTVACKHRVVREAVDYRLRHRCNHSVVACIDRAAHLHRVSAAQLRGRAWCESRMHPWAINGATGAAGLFQFLPSTYATTPYARRGSVFSAKWNALAAAWMERVGRGGEWVCA